MVFTNATYLWGLLGLLLPLAIHLWSRKKLKTIKVGSIKLLQASEPKQTSSIRINELWLLFLRLLTVLLLVLILAEPRITSVKENLTIQYLIEPSLLNDERLSSILDSIPKEAVRILETRFPKWDDYDVVKPSKALNYWQLAQQMKSLPADSIVVFSKGLVKGIKGARPIIQANTRWIVIEPDLGTEKAIAVRQKDASVEVLSISNDERTLSFKKKRITSASDLVEINLKGDSIRLKAHGSEDWMLLKKNNPIRICIVNTDSLLEQISYFKAAYRGISKFLDRPLEIDSFENLDSIKLDDYHTIISFENTELIHAKVNQLRYQPNEFANQLIENGPAKNIFHLTELLNSENIIKEYLPVKLWSLLDLNTDLEYVINANDRRVVSEKELQPLTYDGERLKSTIATLQLTPWLWLFFILVILVERILAKLRKQ